VTHILPCTIPLSPPPLTSDRAEPVRCQRRARTPQAHCTTRRDHRDAQARTLLFGRAEPIATRPLSGKPPTKSRRCRPRRALLPQRAMSDPACPSAGPLEELLAGVLRGKGCSGRSAARRTGASISALHHPPRPVIHAPSSRCEIAAGVLPFRDLSHDPSGILGPHRPPSATCRQAVFPARDRSWQPQHPLPHREPLTVVPASSSISPASSRHATLPHGQGIGRVARAPSSRHRASPRGARIGQMSSLAPGNTPGSAAAGQQVSVRSVPRFAERMDAGATATARTGERLIVSSGVPLSRHCGCTSRVTFDSAARRFDDPLVEPDCCAVSQLGRTLIPDTIDRRVRQTALACHCSRKGTTADHALSASDRGRRPRRSNGVSFASSSPFTTRQTHRAPDSRRRTIHSRRRPATRQSTVPARPQTGGESQRGFPFRAPSSGPAAPDSQLHWTVRYRDNDTTDAAGAGPSRQRG